MVADPAPTPVTSPAPLTLAMLPLLLVQDTARPLSARPAESCGVAVSCSVLPTARLPVAGVTLTNTTGAGAGATVVPVARFDRFPKTAFTLRVPRYATSSKL